MGGSVDPSGKCEHGRRGRIVSRSSRSGCEQAYRRSGEGSGVHLCIASPAARGKRGVGRTACPDGVAGGPANAVRGKVEGAGIGLTPRLSLICGAAFEKTSAVRSRIPTMKRWAGSWAVSQSSNPGLGRGFLVSLTAFVSSTKFTARLSLSDRLSPTRSIWKPLLAVAQISRK